MMTLYRRRSVVVALFGLLTSAAVATPALAEVGAVSVVFTKGGLIVGVGGGQGVLVFRGGPGSPRRSAASAASATPSRCRA